MDLLFDVSSVSDPQLEKLRKYEAFLKKWNKNVNIVSASNANIIWERHIVDSLQLVPLLADVSKIADMGSGFGLPAVPLAIACPDINVFAVEANTKKTALLTELTRELGLPNLHVLPEKVQKVVISHMDAVCCRAFGEFIRDAGLAYKMLKPGGIFLTFKSEEELRVPNGFEKVTNRKYRLKNYTRDFHIVVAYKFGEFD